MRSGGSGERKSKLSQSGPHPNLTLHHTITAAMRGLFAINSIKPAMTSPLIDVGTILQSQKKKTTGLRYYADISALFSLERVF